MLKRSKNVAAAGVMAPGLVAAGLACAGLMATIAATGAPTTADAADAPLEVLPPVTEQSGPEQDAIAVAARVARFATDKDMGKAAGTVIIDPHSDDVLYEEDAGVALIPASTNKIPTAVAATRLIGANTRLTTRTTKATDGSQVYIVGGGDPLLVTKKVKAEPGHPVYPRNTPLRKLARETATSLKQQNVSDIELLVDDTLFSGPAWNPSWPAYYRTEGNVSPVTAFLVNDGRMGIPWGPKVADPAIHGGQLFADLLRKRGLTVSSVKLGRSPENAEPLGQIQSVPIFELTAQALSSSDNDTAEMLFRLAGIAGGFGGSFEGGSKAVSKSLDDIGISSILSTFVDGSGLSKDNRLTVNLLADVLRGVVKGDEGLWPIGTGLSVAGVSGTLAGRFRTSTTSTAAGWVRGKTGTLTGVSGLAGFAQSESGRMMAFATIANDAKSSYEAATKMDELVAAAVTCGCPGDDR